jgi:protein arginine N-methyltransferase 1
MPDPEDHVPHEGEDADAEYFESYSGAEVHRMMLADRVRTEAYRDALEQLVEPGSVVLDVGTGTGILSLFAARAGARRVYAVDSAEVLDAAERIAEASGYGDVIEFIDGRAEELELPEPVDLIVSEWMGLFALTEVMFPSVIAAAARHLRPGGHLVPGAIRLYLTPVRAPRHYVEHGPGFWTEDLYGFDYSPMVNYEIAGFESVTIEGADCVPLAPAGLLVDVDCHEAAAEDYWFDMRLVFEIEEEGPLHGFLGHFEAELAPGVTLSTAHDRPMTHWRQSWFPVRERDVRRGDRLEVRFRARADETGGDARRPIYFTEGCWMRGEEELERFFYCHHGTYE